MHLKNISIRWKLFILVSLMMLSITAIYLISLKLAHNDLIESRKTIIKSVVDSAASQLKPILSLDNHTLSDKEKRTQIRQLVQTLRYGENNYLFAYNLAGETIANPTLSQIDGQDTRHLKGQNNNDMLQPMLQGIRKQGEVYWHYYWPKAGETEPSEKLSYAKLIPGTDLIIGSGIHLEEIQQLYVTHSITFTLLATFFGLLTYLIASRIASSITAPTARLVTQIEQLTSGHLTEEITDAERQDEIGSIAKALVHFRQQTIENQDLKQISLQEKHLATYDPVTQLLSRKGIENELSLLLVSLPKGEQSAVLAIKLPLLRDILSRWGSDYCNLILIDISNRIKKTLGVNDLLARYSDDTLMLIRPELSDTREINILINAIQTAIMQPAQIDGQQLSFQSRVGVSIAPDDGTQELQLFGHAEEALSEARRLELDYMFFSQLKTFALDERLVLWKDIQQALEEDQFYLVFQPLHDLHTNKIISAEVLLRWEHPERGFISPATFVVFAEQSGLVTRLDNWVLKAAAKQINEWKEAGIEVPQLAVNLSGLTFMRSDLKQLIQEATAEYDFPLSALELELTEGVLIASIETLQEKIHTIQEMGISISIDDFGTGYSSLSRIRNLQINKIKIDRSFIQDLESNQSDKKIIEAIILMAQGLDVKVVAEGVETPEQLNILRAMNCDIAQGFLLSKPLKKEKLIQLLENQNLIIEVD
ncbi:EAL domain-containing protein [Neptunomonas qingdaonensis]|uniref:Diguanylate cyclase (GGDEF) domain-containing protein n=1 Tax=Neptunomonas qingdaonensis TaxID=1045558 RepID=A0A1I2M0X6_9GAMM|nr:EAL domain-containing protein [Neptunomonas qingdaonensis]SFF85272.1 diguanylate cyclase (GGDEF) domain-containing protein [Neptunomonas qingdaonensis]